jgi:hypothetical protein
VVPDRAETIRARGAALRSPTKITDSTQLIVTAGKRRVAQKTLRIQEFSLPQWRRMLRSVGLRLLRAYSGYDGRPYRAGSTGRLILMAQK